MTEHLDKPLIRFPGSFELHVDRIRDITPEVMGADGRMRVLSAGYWATTTAEERALFGHRHGIYSFPTRELVDHLDHLIGDDTAMEVGAGHGVLAAALAIIGVDDHQQVKMPLALVYAAAGQPPVRYGPNVLDLDANEAVRAGQPDVVIGCWVTHEYDADDHDAGGNARGIDQVDVLANCGTFVLVGNDVVHALNPLWSRRPYSITYPPFVYSRASRGREFIAVWRGTGPREMP